MTTLSIAFLLAACGGGSRAPEPRPQPPEVQRTAAEAADLRDMLLDVAAEEGCQMLEGSFLSIGEGAAAQGESKPTVGVLWIQECNANRTRGHIRLTLSGSGWRWLSREKEKLLAQFEVAQYARFDYRIFTRVTADMAYDVEEHVFTAWLTPEERPEVEIEPVGDIKVDAETFWGETVRFGAELLGKEPGEQPEKALRKKGARRFATKLVHGLTFVADLCTGRTYTKLGSLPTGKVPEPPVDPGDRKFAVNDRATLHEKGLLAWGPFGDEPGPLNVEVHAGEDPVELRVVCAEQARAAARHFVQTGTLPEDIQSLERRVVQGTETFQVPVGACRPAILATPAGAVPTTFEFMAWFEGARTEPLAACQDEHEPISAR